MRSLVWLLLIAVFPVWAGKYPVITSITPENLDDEGIYTQVRAYITQSVVEIGPAADEHFVPGYYASSVWLVYRDCTASTGVCMTNTLTPGIPTNAEETIGVQAIRSYETYGKQKAFVYLPKTNRGRSLCLGYAVSGQGQNWSFTKAPAGCTIVPPVGEWCKITTPELVLDHGTITLRQAEGSTARTQMGVRCTTSTAVTFNLMTDDKYVYLDEGKSEITVADAPLKTKIDLPAGDSSLTVKDLLTGINSEGQHTGSSVLVMMPY